MSKAIIAMCAASAVLLIAGCAATGSSRTSTSTTSLNTSKPSQPSSTAAAPARKRDRLENIPLVWKPTTSVAKLGAVDLTGLANSKLQIDPVTDNRSDPGFIGQNSEKQPARKVTTPDNVSAFVTDHMRKLFGSGGINVVDSGGTTVLKSEIQQFFVEETETYKGDVRLKVTLSDASGKQLWTGITGGTSTRFGRSYKAENYYETLSDSVIEAVYNLLQNPGFRAALAARS
jgi:hypothetical protein